MFQFDCYSLSIQITDRVPSQQLCFYGHSLIHLLFNVFGYPYQSSQCYIIFLTTLLEYNCFTMVC